MGGHLFSSLHAGVSLPDTHKHSWTNTADGTFTQTDVTARDTLYTFVICIVSRISLNMIRI